MDAGSVTVETGTTAIPFAAVGPGVASVVSVAVAPAAVAVTSPSPSVQAALAVPVSVVKLAFEVVNAALQTTVTIQPSAIALPLRAAPPDATSDQSLATAAVGLAVGPVAAINVSVIIDLTQQFDATLDSAVGLALLEAVSTLVTPDTTATLVTIDGVGTVVVLDSGNRTVDVE